MIPPADLTLPGSGTVLRPFPFRFDFPLQEGFDFLTDIRLSDDGSEQRIAVRDPARPRLLVKGHVVSFDRDEVAHLMALLFGWNLHNYGVPLWMHAMTLSANATAGDTVLNVVDQTGRDLEARLVAEDDVPVLLWSAHDNWEPAILSATAAGTLTVRDPIANDWPMAGTIVLPLALMALGDLIETQRPARGIAELDLEFVESHVPGSPNEAELCGAPEAPSEDAAPMFAQMVRPANPPTYYVSGGTNVAHDNNNEGGLHPRSSDSPTTWDLFGFSSVVAQGVVVNHGKGMYGSSGGRDSNFKWCIGSKVGECPPEFEQFLVGIGIKSSGPGRVVGTDYTVSVYRESEHPMTPPYPVGVPDTDGDYVVAGSFTGSGYFGDPGAPTAREWIVVRMSLKSGIYQWLGDSNGSNISSYGRYDVGAPGGIRYYGGLGYGETPLNSNYIVLGHGFCIRASSSTVRDYVGVKIVTEEVLYSSGDPDWIESGAFGTPSVTTHMYSGDEIVTGSAFVIHRTGGATVFGGYHDSVGDNGDYNGYGHGTDHELFRVTVSLIHSDATEEVQFIDIFPAMMVDAVLGT